MRGCREGTRVRREVNVVVRLTAQVGRPWNCATVRPAKMAAESETVGKSILCVSGYIAVA